MKSASTIQHLHHNEIDKTRWDECIVKAENSLIYAHSFYLDAMAPGWTALTNDDYDWVFPITSRRKWGVKYLYQPNFTQQLGVFFKSENNVPWDAIFKWLQTRFRFWEISWNYAMPDKISEYPVRIRPATNFVLDLSEWYNDIANDYHNDLKKNLKHSKRFPLHYQSVLDYEKSIDLYIEHYGSRLPHVNKTHYSAFKKVCTEAYKNDKLICREVVDTTNNVLAIALLLSDGNRLYNMMNTTTEEGRKSEANHLLIDSLIKEFAETEQLLDFEGSDLAGVKAFYKNFGAINQSYYMLKYNRLPWLLKWLKS